MTRKILLADDSVTIQKVVELTFAEGDYQVQCVSNGKAAVQKIQEDRPDLLLCDVIMPEMNGYDVATFVKQNPTFSSIPVILLTGTFEPFDENKARQSGADTYITKPFDSKMLVDKVEELLKRRATFDSSAHEVVQVFHSRTEFSIGEQPPEPQAILSEAPLPTEPPLPVSAGTEGGGTISGDAEEEPFLRHEESVFEQDQTVQMSVPSLDLHQAIPDAEPVIEAIGVTADKVPHVDIGPSEDDSISDAAFSDILAPEPLSVAAAEEDVVLSAEGVHEWPASESSLLSQDAAPESVSGSEDWGAGQSISPAADAVLDVPDTVEALAEPGPVLPPFTEEPGQDDIVHDLTEQQSMVAEAQEQLDHPTQATPPEPITGAYEISSAQETVSPGMDESAAQETPFLPDEGLEVGIEEVVPQAASPLPVAEVVPILPVSLPMVVTQDTGSYPTPTEQGLDNEVIPQEVEAAPLGGEPAESAAVVPPASSPARGEIEAMVRDAVAAILPGLVAQGLPDLVRTHMTERLPVLVRQHASEMLPALVDPLVREGVSDAVNQRVPGVVNEAVGAEIQRALADAVPDRVRQVTHEIAPGIISEETRSSLAQEIARVSREVAPEIIRQVAWEVIPELAESLIKRRIQELESQPG